MASAGFTLSDSASSDVANSISENSDHSTERPQVPLLPSVRAALLQLLQAYDYAADLRKSVWDFAVELSCLRQFGVTRNDCRWLTHKGYVAGGKEVAISAEGERNFEPVAGTRIHDDVSFVLTPLGHEFARRLQSTGSLLPASLSNMIPTDARNSPWASVVPSDATRPTWDQQRQELRVGRVVIKQYKVPAANQEAILASFQEEEWPPRIDDPLVPKGDQDPKRRLHDTINSLNRNQKRSVLHFFGDGTGQGVRWEFREETMRLLSI